MESRFCIGRGNVIPPVTGLQGEHQASHAGEQKVLAAAGGGVCMAKWKMYCFPRNLLVDW